MSISQKLVIFDWGGIVESHENNLEDLNGAKIRLIKRFNKDISEQEILERWTDKTLSGIPLEATNNPNHLEEWFDLTQKNMNINTTFEKFKKTYEEEFAKVKYYKDVVEFAHSLKKNCKIAILSNLMPLDRVRIDSEYDFSKFDYVYLSFELGMEKPNKKIYEYVVKDSGFEPQNILFIDDDANNILVAKQCNWNAFQGQGYKLEEIKNSVYKFLAEK